MKRPSGALRRGASLVVLRGDAVLMVRRARPPLDGLWSFPGGRLEPGETAAAAARRELREETGLAVGEIVALGRFRPLPSSPFLLTVFAARAGTGEPVAGDDAAAAEFVPLCRVGDRAATPGARRWIAAAIVALTPSLAARIGRAGRNRDARGGVLSAIEPKEAEMAATHATPGMLESPNPLIASDRVEGTAVLRPDGEKVGTIQRVMIDKLSGQVAYAVMSFGGFLGLGDRYITLPWSKLDYNPDLDGYVVDVTEDQLKAAPDYDSEGEIWTDRRREEELHRYYDVPPYW